MRSLPDIHSSDRFAGCRHISHETAIQWFSLSRNRFPFRIIPLNTSPVARAVVFAKRTSAIGIARVDLGQTKNSGCPTPKPRPERDQEEAGGSS
ncbi:hypothetical protein ACSYAY_10935 [Leptospirillum ferriphilum]|uniref:hypothetical protein n=1 Tax=Leptospirillum ferriphilum TaxID=178606 RepID=UPI003EE46ED2